MNWTNKGLRGLVVGAMSVLVAASAWAQNFPAKAVNLMVPYPAGGLSDVIARVVEQDRKSTRLNSSH